MNRLTTYLLAAALFLALPASGFTQETEPAPQPEPTPAVPPVAPPDAAPQPESNPQPEKPQVPATKPLPPTVTTPSPAPEKPAAQPETPAEVPPARQIFLTAADALKGAQSITYRIKSYAEGKMLATYISRTQADVRMLRTPNGWQERVTGSGSSMSHPDNTEFDMAWIGPHTEWVDHTAKKVFEKALRDVKGPAVQMAPSSRMDEFMSPTPYATEIAATDYTLEERKEKDGVMCDVIVVRATKGAKVKWMIGVEDHLPRWKERIIENTAAAGSMISEISAVVVDKTNPPRLTAEMVRVTVPAGYEEDRVPPPPPPVAPVEKPVPDKAAPAVEKPLAAGPIGPPAPAPTPEPPVAAKAPDFELKDGAGATVSLASLKGSVVVLEFAGSWCLPLRDAHPEFDTFSKDYKQLPVKTFMLDVREKAAENAKEDLKKLNATFALLLDADPIARQYNIKKYPTYVVIDKEGDIAKVEAGYKKVETINSVREAVNKIIGEGAPALVPAPEPAPEAKPEVKQDTKPDVKPDVKPVIKSAPPKK